MKKTYCILNDVEILSAGAEGKAVAKHEGLAVFVPYAVPGDVVDIEIYKRKRSYAEANLLKIKRPSPDRVVPPCPHFGVCGGCKWQMMDYRKQLHYKQQQVEDSFRHLGKFDFPPLHPIIGSEKIYYYRNKLEFTFSNMRWFSYEEMRRRNAGEDIEPRCAGFHVPGKFDKVLDIGHCRLQTAPSNDLRLFIRDYAIRHDVSFYDVRRRSGLLRNLVVRTATTGEVMAILVVSAFEPEIEGLLQAVAGRFPELTSLMYVVNEKLNDAIFDLPCHVFAGRNHIVEQMEDLRFKIGPQSFFQTNSEQALKLYSAVRGFAGIQPDDTVYDLYTGTGTIANFVARSARRVVGIEYVDAAVEDARENSATNHITNTEFVAGDMAKVFTGEFVEAHGRPQVVITDPPRAGMHPKVVERLLDLQASRMVYVSCNPATQARDLTRLASKYDIAAVQPVDMFPHTQHVENAVLLVLRPSDGTAGTASKPPIGTDNSI